MVNRLLPKQTFQDVVNCRAVDVKVSDAFADIFFGAIAQHLQFGPIGANNFAFARYEMQRNCCIFKKVLKLVGGFVGRRRLVKAIDGADDVSCAVFDRLNVNRRPNRRAVGPLDLACHAKHRDPSPQDLGHRSFVMWRQPPLKEHLIGAAKFLAVAGQVGLAAP